MEKCVEEIIEISKNNFHYDKDMKQKSDKLREKFLKYVDKGNCERVYSEILKRIN